MKTISFGSGHTHCTSLRSMSMLKNEFPFLVKKACPYAELVLIIPICRHSYSRRSTLTALQMGKVLLSGARLYLHIPLHSLKRPGKGLDTWARWQGTVCICATRERYQPPKQDNCLLGIMRRKMNDKMVCALAQGSGYTPGPLCWNSLIPVSAALVAVGGCRLFTLIHPSRSQLLSWLTVFPVWAHDTFPTCLSPDWGVGDKTCGHTMLLL